MRHSYRKIVGYAHGDKYVCLNGRMISHVGRIIELKHEPAKNLESSINCFNLICTPDSQNWFAQLFHPRFCQRWDDGTIRTPL